MQLTIALAPTRARSIRAASPRTARRWFSNWLVSAPSIVQCPLLCTRGAISFASSRAVEVEQLDAADADVVERVEQRHDAGFRRGLQRAVVPARRRAGDAQDAVAVLVLDDRPARESRRRARARRRSTAHGRTARTLRGSAARRRAAAHARVDVGGACAAPPGPCRRSRRAGSSAPPGRPTPATARSRSARESTAWNAAVGDPEVGAACFSASRSCATSSARGGGSTGASAARCAARCRPARLPTRR